MVSIYRLFSRLNNDCYVGGSMDIRKRFREHRCLLRKGKHKSPKLQALWDAQGEDAFHIEQLEECHYTVKHQREQHWIDYYLERGNLLNDNPRSSGPKAEDRARGIQNAAIRNIGRPIPQEVRAKISVGMKKYFAGRD